MIFASPLVQGRLLRRYKRFLADVELPGGEVLTVHCPNTGAMTGCSHPGSAVWLSDSDNARRKYRYTLEIVAAGEHRVCVNTARANQIVAEGIESGCVPPLSGYSELRREPPVPGGGGRFDFRLAGPGKVDCHVEVKSLTLALEDGYGAFPDAVSERALRHVRALIRVCEERAERAVLFFCVLHTGVRIATTADAIQPAYGEMVREAMHSGVEVFAWGSAIGTKGIHLTGELPFVTPCQEPAPRPGGAQAAMRGPATGAGGTA